MPTNTTMRALAIGPRELFSGLAAFGVDVRHATSKQDALEILSSVRKEQETNPYAIIFISETIITSMNEEEYAQALGEELPVVLTVPDLSSSEDAGLAKLSALTKRAIGTDLFSK